MIRCTYRHIPGIGQATERRLWSAGFASWERDPLPEPSASGLTRRARRLLEEFIPLSRRALQEEDPCFFARGLPPGQLWRLFPEFRAGAAYLDIETTGLFAGEHHITTIALYDGRRVRTYLYGRNLSEFARDIREYRLLVSYNGRCFDVPFLERAFDIRLRQPHIDLRYLLHGLGYSGGLKRCEESLGIDRGGLKGVDGLFAVLLWNRYEETGSDAALETLLAYNVADVLNLERLLCCAYNLKLRETPFASTHRVEQRPPADNPYRPDPGILEELRARVAGCGEPPAW